MFTPHCQVAVTFFHITVVTGLHSLPPVLQTTQLFQNGKCCHFLVKGSTAHIDVVESDQKLCSQSIDCTNYLWRLAVAVPTVFGGSATCRGWQWLYQLSLEVCSGSTNCLWRFHDVHRLTVIPTVSGSPVTCRGWQWLYRLSLELLLDAQLTRHAPALAQGTK